MKKLTKNTQGIFAVRFRICKELQPYFNEKESIYKSLKTKNLIEAKSKAVIIINKYEELLKVKHLLTSEQIQQLVEIYIKEQLDQDKLLRSKPERDGRGLIGGADTPSMLYDITRDYIFDCTTDLNTGNYSGVEDEAKDILNGVGIEYDETNSEHRLFLQRLLRGRIEVLEEVANRYNGNYNSKYDEAVKVEVKPTVEDITKVSKVVTVLDAFNIFDGWYSRQGLTEKHYNETVNRLQRIIIPYFGELTDIQSITSTHIEEFKEFLAVDMPNTLFLPYKDMSFQEIANLKSIPQDKLVGVKTQMKYLKICKQFFSYLLDEAVISRDPTKRLNLKGFDNEKAKDSSFTFDELEKIKQGFKTLDNRKYIYSILMFTGMRPAELWKARIGTSEDGIKYFDLDYQGIELKTLTSRRKIPLHQKLLEMGIDEKLESLQQEFKQEGVSRYFNNTFKEAVGFDDDKVMYNFRHTVATHLKYQEVMSDKISEILGHGYENSNMTKEVYQGGYQLKTLQEAINKLDF